ARKIASTGAKASNDAVAMWLAKTNAAASRERPSSTFNRSGPFMPEIERAGAAARQSTERPSEPYADAPSRLFVVPAERGDPMCFGVTDAGFPLAGITSALLRFRGNYVSLAALPQLSPTQARSRRRYRECARCSPSAARPATARD